MRKKILFLIIIILITLLLIFSSFKFKKEKRKINIGYQSITAQTWGAIVIKEFDLIRDFLNEDVVIEWNNFFSGPPITSNMISGKIQIGFMGDMPLIINGDKGQTSKYYYSKLFFLDGKGINGKNQNVVVLKDSGIKSFKDLKNKTVSVANSSSAHRNLLQELSLANIEENMVNIIFQDIPTAIIMLKNKNVDAISVWEPYPELLINSGKVEFLPKKDNIKYLAGVVINNDWAEQNKDLLVAFEKSLNKAHCMLTEGSDEVINVISDSTGFDKKIVKNVINNIVWEREILDEDIDALKEDIIFLKQLNKISDNFNINEFINKKN
jgi:NitT/TauT family transport system substrate-binding protein